MNDRDSEIMAQSLGEHDYAETLQVDDADLVILNTCSIRAKAEQKVMSLLGYLRKIKQKKPELKICVAGCVAQQEGKRLVEKMPHVDVVAGTQHIYHIPQLLAEAQRQNGPRVAVELSDSYAIPRFIPDTGPSSPASAPATLQETEFSRFVTIMQGCNNYCTYCVVPYTRGREVSRNIKDIEDEVDVLVKSGVREITLLGQNVNSYGSTNAVTDDGSPCSFPQLLERIAGIDNLQRLRFTTSNPKDLSEELMRCFRDLPSLCPQFHLPVQSGSNAVLKKMNRKYSIEKYKYLVDVLRNYCPEIVLTTDVIVGFPGETEEDFAQTMALLESVRFDGSFSFKYSDRPGTASLALPDKVPEEQKASRLSRFQRRQDEISLERNTMYIGEMHEVMVEKRDTEKYRCRARTNHVVHVRSEEYLEPGQIVDVTITHAGQHSLQAQYGSNPIIS